MNAKHNEQSDHLHGPAKMISAPDGWKLVPDEATLDMGWAYLSTAGGTDKGRDWAFSHPGYRAMLKAAPTPPADQQDYKSLYHAEQKLRLDAEACADMLRGSQQDADKVDALPVRLPPSIRYALEFYAEGTTSCPGTRVEIERHEQSLDWEKDGETYDGRSRFKATTVRADAALRNLEEWLANSALPDPAMAGDDLSLIEQLREYAADNGYSHNDYADTMRAAASALSRVQPASGDDDDIDTLQRLLEGKTVSMDVSTADHDAGNRIYGKVYCVQEDSDDGFTVLVIEDSRNFVQPASGAISDDLLRFLHGSGEIDDVAFGESHPSHRGKFWWRALLPQPGDLKPSSGEDA